MFLSLGTCNSVELVPLRMNTHYANLVNVIQMLLCFKNYTSAPMRQNM
jgi:hypothetical protein